MKKITYEIEWNLERFHWWFVGRRKLFKSLFALLGIQNDLRVIDIGCGVGSNLRLLQSMCSKLVGMDSEMYGLVHTKKSLSAVALVNGDLMRLPFKADSVDLILASDVLEHLDEDTIGIREIYRSLKRGGKVIFTVPAFRSLWGVQDIVGMHKRRYSKKELVTKIEGEGFKILRSSYFNFFLFFPILIGRRIIYLLGLRIESENEINLPLINFFLKTVFSIEPHYLKYFSFPFGVSIYCIAKKA
jgi:SAM-dependent methyltransferase